MSPATPRARSERRTEGARYRQNELCCCDCLPRASVWIETRSRSIFVENAITEMRQLDVTRTLNATAQAGAHTNEEQRTATNASADPTSGPAINADAFSGARSVDDSSSDSGTNFQDDVTKTVELRKPQGKVYRTDSYIVHWDARGHGDLEVTLTVTGAVTFQGSWLRPEGRVELANVLPMIQPPYVVPVQQAVAVLRIRDCHGHLVENANTATIV